MDRNSLVNLFRSNARATPGENIFMKAANRPNPSLSKVLSQLKYPFPLGATVSADTYASGPAPSGFKWDFVTISNVRVTLSGVPVVALVVIQ